MRARLAAISSLIVLVFAVIIISIHANAAVRFTNADTSEALKSACRLSAVALDSAASSGLEADGATLDAYPELDKYDICLFNAEGRILFSNSVEKVALQPHELEYAVADSVTLYQDSYNNTVDQYHYAIIALNSGDILRLSYPVYALGDWMLARSLQYVLITAAAMLAMYCYAFRSLNKQHRMISRIIRVLEDFTEGHYSSRIEGVEGDSVAQTEQFNAVVSRLEEKVFRVGTRNRAFNNVMNQMRSGILVVDSGMRVALISAAAKQMLGIKGNAEGQYIGNLNKDVPLEEVFQKAASVDGVHMCEIAVRAETGRARKPLRLYISAMMQDGNVAGMLAMVEDISEMRHLEQVRTDFAANVSHELKTPLTSIRGFVETLMDGAIDNPTYARKFLGIIMSETNRLTRLINDILSISKLESGGDEVETERLQLDKQIDDVCEMLSMHAEDKQIKLTYHRPPAPVYIVGNHDRVDQMLINLIENGIKYNQPGGSVTVNVYANKASGACNVSISDTGIGISEEHIPRLFERFYRVDKGRSRSMGGTGLGLAIVKHIIRTMKGSIEVHSKLNEGTEFLVTLPLASEGDKGTMGHKLDEDKLLD